MKRISVIALILILALPSFAQRPRVGLVLSGGGAKGAAHVGVLKVLEEKGIPIDCIAGTSMGALVGGLYAMGWKAAELDSILLSQDWDVVMSDRIPRDERWFERKQDQSRYLLRIPFGSGDYSSLGARTRRKDEKSESSSVLSNIPLAVVDGQNVYNLLTRLSVGYQDSIDFNRMPIPFSCVAVDLIGKNEVIFHHGRLVEALRSSMAIPGYFSPVRKGNMVLIDGGALNNYPVDVARAMGADIIIGVVLGEAGQREPTIDNIGDLVSEMANLYMDTKYPDAIAATDILIRPDTKGYNTLSFDTLSLRTLIDHGVDAAREADSSLVALKEMLDKASAGDLGPAPRVDRYHKVVRLDRDSITLGNVSYEGLSAKDAELLLRKSPLKPGARIAGGTIEAEVERFYNTSAFQSVTYQLKGQEEPFDLELRFVGGRKSMASLGARFDNEEIASILLGVGFGENALYGSKFYLTAKLAYNMQAGLQYAYAFPSLARFSAGYHFRSSDLNIMDTGQRSNMLFNQHSAIVQFSTEKIRSLSISMGARYDFFHYRGLLSEAETLPTYDTDTKRAHFISPFVRFQFDRRDNASFPNRGSALEADAAWHFDSMFGDYTNFATTHARWMMAIPAGKILTFIVNLEGRVILGGNAPLAYANIMGGNLAGRYLDQQMPFIGFGFTHVFKNVLSTATLDMRFRFLENHYVTASGAAALSFQNFKEPSSDWDLLGGVKLGYAYNSFFGPLAFDIFWSDYTRKVGLSLSLGYSF